MTRPVRLLATLLLGAVALRVVAAVYLGDTVPPAKDETSYHTLATRVASGHGYTFPAGWYPFTPPDTPTSHWSFLYTAFLAGIYALAGPHPLAGRLAGAVAGGALLPSLTYRLARRLAPAGAANAGIPLLAAALAAVYAYFVFFAAQLMTETFFICALLWSLERAMTMEDALQGAAPRRQLAGVALGLGMALAAATLIRQSILPWAVVLFAYLLWRGGRGPRLALSCGALLIAGLVIVAAVLPFTARNLRVYDGSFLLLNSNAGYAMYSAQHPDHGVTFREYWGAPLPPDLEAQTLNEAQWDKALMRRGIGFVLAEPERYLRLSLSRVRDYFECWPTADSSPLFSLGRMLSAGILLPFMAGGIALWLRPVTRAKYGLRNPALPLLFMTFYSVMHILTWAMSRYRLPVDAVALPFAALCLTVLRDVISHRREPRGGTTLTSPP